MPHRRIPSEGSWTGKSTGPKKEIRVDLKRQSTGKLILKKKKPKEKKKRKRQKSTGARQRKKRK